MRPLLAFLLCFVLLESQVFAIWGGPSVSASTTPVGVYAGVFVPVLGGASVKYENPSTAGQAEANYSSSLGLFVLGVPEQGVADGQFLLFDNGDSFAGTLIGFADPRTNTITAIANGPSLSNAGASEYLSPASLSGKMTANIEPPTVDPWTSSIVLANLTGNAQFDLAGKVPDTSPSGYGYATLQTLTYAIDGYKQSDAYVGLTIPTPSVVTSGT